MNAICYSAYFWVFTFCVDLIFLISLCGFMVCIGYVNLCCQIVGLMDTFNTGGVFDGTLCRKRAIL